MGGGAKGHREGAYDSLLLYVYMCGAYMLINEEARDRIQSVRFVVLLYVGSDP